MIEAILEGFWYALSIEALLAVVAGVLLGQLGGALPGLTVSVTMVLILPLSFFLSPTTAWGLFIGVYVGGMTGGSMPAILLNIPGTPSASATGIEGYALAQRGQAGVAIGTAILASTVGTFISWLALVAAAPQLARIALQFQATELAAMLFLALTVIASFGGSNPLKGLIAGVVGIALGTVGLDPILGTPRFTLGIVELQGGISFLAAMVGLFAIPQLLVELGNRQPAMWTSAKIRIRDVISALRHFRTLLPAMLGGSAVGIGVGVVPGASAPIAVFLAYRYLRRQGGPDSPSLAGVAVPEAANNAVTGSAFIPLLTLGIPGDTVTAILLGAFLIQGIYPGPVLFTMHTDIVYAIFTLFLVAIVANYFGGLLMARLVLYCLRIPREVLWTGIAILCVVGPFALRNTLLDVAVTVAFGILGYGMRWYGFPVIPLVLGLMLGPMFENYLRTALITSQGDWTVFMTRPLSLTFIVLGLALLAVQLTRSHQQLTSTETA